MGSAHSAGGCACPAAQRHPASHRSIPTGMQHPAAPRSPHPHPNIPRAASRRRPAQHRSGILADANNPAPQGGSLGLACYSRLKVVNNLPGAGDRGKPQRCHVLAGATAITGEKQHGVFQALLKKCKAKVKNAAPIRGKKK